MRRTSLYLYDVMPYKINGRVVIRHPNGLKSYAVSKYCDMPEHFDPVHYVLLDSGAYTCIATARTEEIILAKAQRLFDSAKVKDPVYRIGDKIHITQRNGIYTVVGMTRNVITITCNKWQYEEKKTHEIPSHSFKCLAGSYYNYAE